MNSTDNALLFIYPDDEALGWSISAPPATVPRAAMRLSVAT
ncbi:hypothetical protein [Streptomyces virginiae]